MTTQRNCDECGAVKTVQTVTEHGVPLERCSQCGSTWQTVK